MKRQQRFPLEAASVPAARRFAASVLADLDPDQLETIILMVSELASNSVLHAETPFTISIVRRDGLVQVEVTDLGEGTPELRSPSPKEPRGRGLRIVDAFSDSWDVRPKRGHGNVVTFTVRERSA